jgi:RNA polymerase sigma factor (sigma-70 family)
MSSPETPPEPASDQPSDAVPQVVEHLFRHESARIVATLTGIFGVEHLTLAEDVVQETLARALQTWPFYGVPDNPAAWIMRASRNLALDVVRRQKVFRDKEPEIIRLLEDHMDRPNAGSASGPESDELSDDRLRLMFVCCHPVVPVEAQVALALRTLCGFGTEEISRAFLTSEAAIAKRLVRARAKIRDAQIPFAIPEGAELAERLDGVLHTLYLLFNEGYKTSVGPKLIREDICHEAIRLASLLTSHPAGNQPKAHALLALMLLNAARLPARVDDDGNLVRLPEQDRSQWDRSLIARGMLHIARSAAGAEISEYHVQAGIAAVHAASADEASTDWRRIRVLYDHWITMDDSPVVALNRAVAISMLEGPQAGLAAVIAIPQRAKLESYYLLYSVLGDFESRLGNREAAAAHFRRALELVESDSEKRFLAGRLELVGGRW